MSARQMDRAPSIAVLDYGIGNLRSAQKALQRVGADATLTADREIIDRADGLVLPGVGAFGACMDGLQRTGLDGIAREAARSTRPFLGICVGMQLLYEGSAETPGRSGLGILPGMIVRLPASVKQPQMQWNRLAVTRSHPLVEGLDGSWMYFVHSYAAPPSEATVATTDYGGPVVAAVAVDNVWATQFHPEKSADDGRRLLSNWVDWVARDRLVA